MISTTGGAKNLTGYATAMHQTKPALGTAAYIYKNLTMIHALAGGARGSVDPHLT
jgi:hypothetical protein